MTEAQMKTLFSRFRTRTEVNEAGAGIGLAIAKTIADLHRIEISVSSEIGKGTTFLFIFR
jgi:signal transduction histidine kinase